MQERNAKRQRFSAWAFFDGLDALADAPSYYIHTYSSVALFTFKFSCEIFSKLAAKSFRIHYSANYVGQSNH